MEAPMDRQWLLWILVAANILLAVASVGAEGFFGWTLPPALAAYDHARFVESPLANPSATFHFVVLAALTLCAFAAWIGLLMSWRLAQEGARISGNQVPDFPEPTGGRPCFLDRTGWAEWR